MIFGFNIIIYLRILFQYFLLFLCYIFGFRFIYNFTKYFVRKDIIFIKLMQGIGSIHNLENRVQPNFYNFLQEFKDHNYQHPMRDSNLILQESNLNITVSSGDLIGVGSIAQVYSGSYNSKPVAVKIKHPHADKCIEFIPCYTTITRPILGFLNILDSVDMETIFKDILQQIDFYQEAEYCRRFGEIFDQDEMVSIPEIYFNNSRVIILQKLDSVFPRKEEITDQIREKVLYFLFKSIHNGIMHSDMHNRNWGIGNGKLVVYDFGHSCRVNRDYQKYLLCCLTGDYELLFTEILDNDGNFREPKKLSILVTRLLEGKKDIQNLLPNMLPRKIDRRKLQFWKEIILIDSFMGLRHQIYNQNNLDIIVFIANHYSFQKKLDAILFIKKKINDIHYYNCTREPLSLLQKNIIMSFCCYLILYDYNPIFVLHLVRFIETALERNKSQNQNICNNEFSKLPINWLLEYWNDGDATKNIEGALEAILSTI